MPERNETLILVSVNASVALIAKSDQIILCIVTAVTTELFVVNFKVGHRAACLAFPAIPAQHLIAKPPVRLRMKP